MTKTTTRRVEKDGDLLDQPNAADARTLLNTLIGFGDDLASVGGRIDRIDHRHNMAGDAAVYVEIPIDVELASRKHLGMYGVESIEFLGQDTPDIDGVVVSTNLLMETEGPDYLFVIDRTE